MIINNKINEKSNKKIKQKNVNLNIDKEQKKQERLQNKELRKLESNQKTLFFSFDNKWHTFIIPAIIVVVGVIVGVVAFAIAKNNEKNLPSSECFYIAETNNALEQDLTDNKKEKHANAYEAYTVAVESGHNIGKFASSNNGILAWDSEEDCVVKLDRKNNTVTYVIAKGEIINSKDVKLESHDVDLTNKGEYKASRYFIFIEATEFEDNMPYSVYALDDKSTWEEEINICAGFDTGDVESIKYIVLTDHYDALTDCIIRTKEFTTIIKVEECGNTKFNHFGNSGNILIENCKEWNEYGECIGRIELDSGELTVKNGSTVYQINRNNEYLTQVTIEAEGNVYDSTGTLQQNCIYSDAENNSLSVDIFTCTHDLTGNIFSGIYKICYKCGNTLINFVDSEDVKSFNTLLGNYHEEKCSYILPMGTYDDETLSIDYEDAIAWPHESQERCEEHDFVLYNSIQYPGQTGLLCDGMVTDYYRCSLCGKEEIIVDGGCHLLDENNNCLREPFGCLYCLEKEGYTNIINIKNDKYVAYNTFIIDNTPVDPAAQTQAGPAKTNPKLYLTPEIEADQDDNTKYHLYYTIELDSINDMVSIYRMTLKDGIIYVYGTLTKANDGYELGEYEKVYGTIDVLNYNSFDNGGNGVTIDPNTTSVVFILE